MNKTAMIAMICGLGTSVWTWWPQTEVLTDNSPQTKQVLTASGQAVDPNQIASIRVVTLDKEARTPYPFEVKRQNGQWLIPSHFDYPADGGTRVGETAGAVLNVPLGPLVATDKGSHSQYGVLDPMAAETSAEAGKRVTLSDEGGTVLVDVIIGKQKTGTDVYFVRRATENSVYTAAIKPEEMKATFADRVETDLLKISADDLRLATVKDYSVDEGSGRINPRSTVQIRRSDAKSPWEIQPPMVGQVIDETTIQAFTSEASGLKLVGVRPYSNAWLQDRGFYVAQGGRELFGNEGEVSLVAKNGLIYRLFFGEIALGDDQDKVAKVARDGQAQTGSHNRYLAIFVQYDRAVDETLPKPTYSQAAAPAEGAGGEPVTRRADNQDAIDKAIAEGTVRAGKAQARFQKFFYVINDQSFKKLRPSIQQFYKKADVASPAK